MTTVATAHPAFFNSFKNYIPHLEIVKSYKDVKNYDLIIFTGGEDINPNIYGERNTYSNISNSSIERDSQELSILEKALELNKCIFGVCRGHQLVNAFLGGRLYQDLLFDTGRHHEGFHKIVWGSHPLRNFFIKGVNSLHHQAVRRTGRGLYSIADYNGINEACISETDRIITVQFHPEFMDGQQDFFDYLLKWAVFEKPIAQPAQKKKPTYINMQEYLAGININNVEEEDNN
jgi:gamma-glutamyl-gamma-aminobutyrate hydrolase PuuD